METPVRADNLPWICGQLLVTRADNRDFMAAPPAFAATVVARLAASEELAAHIVDCLAESFDSPAAVAGAHDRGRVPVNRIGIEIEAALAFGTGHHGTTRGCLLALDRIAKARRPRKILDLGTGSGVLAIAAARALRRPVLASDSDIIAVR